MKPPCFISTYSNLINMEKKLANRIQKWMNGKECDPEKIQIYPTNICGLNCIFCAQRNENYGYENELSKERWMKLIEEIGGMEVNRVLISGGGEPLARTDVTLDMMEKIKDYNCEGRLITNGVQMDEQICQRIIDMEWDSIIFSVDGPNAKIHDKLRGRDGAFEKTIENIELLQRLKGDHKPEVEINFVLTRKNYKTLPEMIILCKDLNIKHINFEPLTLNNEFDKKLKLKKSERKIFVNKIIPAAKSESNKNISTNLRDLEKIKIEKAGEMGDEIKKNVNDEHTNSLLDAPCYEPWLWPKIEANGDVWPCSTCPTDENVREKSFRDIWHGDKFKEFRKNILRGNLFESCHNCVTSHVEINRRIRKNVERK